MLPFHILGILSLPFLDNSTSSPHPPSLLSQWVLTAAHCVDEFKTKEQMKKLKVKLGALKYDDPNIKPLDVEDVIIHHNYEGSYHVDDIALLKLKEPASIKTNVVEVAKLDDGSTPDGE